MDDFPAGLASPGPRRPRLSVVIPVRNGEHVLERCLRRLRDSVGLDEDEYEVVVVDDASTDGSAALAESFGAWVVRREARCGPAAARNVGAIAAKAPLVLFLDADVAVHPQTLARAVARFDDDPGLAALFGSYDNRPEAPGLVSQYRNLLHHFVHQRGQFEADVRPAMTFWTGCGMIRRDVFLDHGGFDPGLYRRPAIEDIELGYRITRSGGRIVLARDVQAAHLKRWTFLDMVRTDIFQRGVPWMLLMLRSKVKESDLNVGRSGRLSVAATGLGGLAAIGATVWPALGIVVAVCLAAIVGLNRDFYAFLARRKGVVFAMACLPLHLVYFACCGLSVVIASALWHGRLRRAESRLATSAAARGLRLDEPETSAQPIPRPSAARSRRHARWPR
jgi:glycosyltransferase involved in cell wall biosynthesis